MTPTYMYPFLILSYFVGFNIKGYVAHDASSFLVPVDGMTLCLRHMRNDTIPTQRVEAKPSALNNKVRPKKDPVVQSLTVCERALSCCAPFPLQISFALPDQQKDPSSMPNIWVWH